MNPQTYCKEKTKKTLQLSLHHRLLFLWLSYDLLYKCFITIICEGTLTCSLCKSGLDNLAELLCL